MPLQSSGLISLLDIQNEFGGSNPIGINEYYGVAPGIPASGLISLADFYGASACDTTTAPTLTNTYTVSGTNQGYGRYFQVTSSKYYFGHAAYNSNEGRVHIRNHDDTGEILVTRPGGVADDGFWRIAVDESTNTMVVADPGRDANGSQSAGGASWFNATTGAYLNISKTSPYGGWTQWRRGTQGPFWGEPIYADDGKFFICCPYDRCGTSTQYGSVWVYNSSGTLLTSKLGNSGTASTPGTANGVGFTISSVADGRVMAPVTYAATGGKIVVYDYNLNVLHQWPQPSGTVDYWGATASIGQGVIAVGAPAWPYNSGNPGYVYLYDYNYNLQNTIVSPTNTPGFGSVVKVGNGRIIVGNYNYTGTQNRQGRIYIYNLTGSLLATIDDPNALNQGNFGQYPDGVISKYDLMFLTRAQSINNYSSYFDKYSTPENAGCSGP